ncbi:hypothetical protein QBC46DRAFT_385780 [Diplogelasinospora grovesii]|uniref:DUF7770 domain-containing protein n=1 Tax=Diplogelasinospora grovesii TaxID=303347 RepID=A0AAN6N7J7_9PEZI|nr:hypothetical protein QBC46DRAFT_385780 [Diplogelasinospora grovesii]
MSRPSRDRVHRLVYPVAELLANRHTSAGHFFFNHDGSLASNVRDAGVISSYAAVLPPEAAASEPNRWIFVLRTGEQPTIAIELKQTDPLGNNTAVCCSNGPRVLETGELEGCAKTWALATRDGSVVGDWIDRLVETGSTRYRLDQGLGSRWWMDCALLQWRSFFTWPHHDVDDLKIWIRLEWDMDGAPKPPGEIQRLKLGKRLKLDRGEWLEAARDADMFN